MTLFSRKRCMLDEMFHFQRNASKCAIHFWNTKSKLLVFCPFYFIFSQRNALPGQYSHQAITSYFFIDNDYLPKIVPSSFQMFLNFTEKKLTLILVVVVVARLYVATSTTQPYCKILDHILS